MLGSEKFCISCFGFIIKVEDSVPDDFVFAVKARLAQVFQSYANFTGVKSADFEFVKSVPMNDFVSSFCEN
ncbi:MAG: hypothetical protein LBC86_05155 [Oscillospiraceae bacterium]|nr:hypothetical protein [Oscillospiraceae bacterium]